MRSKCVKTMLSVLRRAAVMLLLAAVLFSAVGCDQAAKEAERIREEAAPLEVERDRLKRELSDLERTISNLARSGATLSTVITGVDSAVYSVIYPVYKRVNLKIEQHFARQYGTTIPDSSGNWEIEPDPDREALKHLMTATVCLSADELPGLEGKMNMEQLEELLDAGWSTAIYVTHKEAWRLDAYLTEMEEKQMALGLEPARIVCFEEAVYLMSYDEILLEHGVVCAINTVDEGGALLSHDLTTDVWRVKADGWSGKSNTAMEAYTDLRQSHGASVFLLTVVEGDHRNGPADFRDSIDAPALERMLEYFFEDVIASAVYVASPDTAKARYATYLEDYAKYKLVYEPEVAPLEARLAEIEARLYEIYYGS